MQDEQIRINQKTLEETVKDVTAGLPYVSHLVDMHGLPDDTFPWHWHGEVELFCALEGEVEYHVPGGMQVFRAGEAGFINANVLHMTRAANSAASLQIEHLFLPEFVFGQADSDIERLYVRPVLRSSALDLYRFEPAEPALELMRRAHELYLQRGEGFEMHARSLMSELWLELFRQTRPFHDSGLSVNPDDERVKQMLSFIADHYAEKISLGDIARAGFVGERECFRIFKRSLDTTPLDCLVRKRLAVACELLKSTHRSLIDIALSTGFHSASYFGKVFKARFGVTPGEYRRR